MLPIVALVGRPNVGKSTLFNVVTGTRDAIVSDVPGVTRDRQYGFASHPIACIVIDTGGLIENARGIEAQMRSQTERAVAEADRLILVTDARSGLTAQDELIARELRRAGKPITLAVNKAEGLDPASAAAEFQALGLGAPVVIAAAHGLGCREVIGEALADLVELDDGDATAARVESDPGAIRIAIVGRPNVGKSTLVNRFIGHERVIASAEPGTTRDRILVPFRRDDRDFLLIDTAGVRRRARIEDEIERISVAKTLQAIEEAHVVILVLDAHDSVAEQDASVLGIALERGRALLIAVNKWDGIANEQRETIRRQLALKLDFAAFVPLFFISARYGTGVGELSRAAARAFDAAMREMPTPDLTRTLERAMAAQQPPLVRGRRIKLKLAHQGGRNPPRIIVHGNLVRFVPEAYVRYLSNTFRKTFDLYATPVRVELRSDANPYAARGTRRPRNPRRRPR